MNSTEEDKTVAVVSYITLLGWIIAFIIYGKNKTELGAYHLRQSLGLHITYLLLLLFGVAGKILAVLIFIFAIIGLIYAIQGDKKPVPVLGDIYQSLFKGIN
ncbi:MAG: hypothetical protein FJY07_14265 [Bacteroidetes bacterium]|nr:hypothetical protein [Bacteroidota bacterium]